MSWRAVISDQPQVHYSFSDNAEMVYYNLLSKGFSVPAIIGVLANMEHESYINLGQQELYRGGDESYGYGLVQWTPARDKILNYARTNNLEWSAGSTQMDYFDINVPASWIPTRTYPESFNDFKSSTDIYRATRIFFHNFERGTWDSIMDKYAEHWNEYFSGEPTPPTPIELDYKKLFLILANKNKKY